MNSTDARMLDSFVEAFELQLAHHREIDLADFLPAEDHPLRNAVLCEIIRVDLEFGWERGQACSLNEYRRRFPSFFDDPDLVRGVAFEEFRLRRRAGQNATPDEYHRQYGIDASDWPGALDSDPDCQIRAEREQPGLGPPDHNQPGGELEQVARSYRAFRQQQGPESVNLDGWLQSLAGQKASAKLFGDLHRQQPDLADRLALGLSSLPEPGTDFLGFDLVAELGRGAFGCVFLARQGALANRLVALKIAPDLGGESQTLAQLQHTHIVPIYSLHREGPFQAVCMPFFGTTTLADVLRDLLARPALPRSGTELLSSLQARSWARRKAGKSESIALGPTKQAPSRGRGTDQIARGAAAGPLTQPDGSTKLDRLPDAGPSEPDPNPPILLEAPALKKLEGFNYVEAVLWLGSCLADGLAHAHERGILHRDLKPANVLITDDGQPMLLDFNLAVDTKMPMAASAAMIGGTLPYMAPEHLDAFRGGKSEPDGRSDIFALGIILYELLTGCSPYPDQRESGRSPWAAFGQMDLVVQQMLQQRTQPAPPIQLKNHAISPAVASIIHRCLDPNPARRYQSARQLQEDLQRQLDHQPLKYAREPSFRERIRKRFRREPRLVYRLIAYVAVVLVVLASLFGLRTYQQKRAEQARVQLLEERREAQEILKRFLVDVLDAKFVLNTQTDPAERVRGEDICRRVLELYGVLTRDDWRTQRLFTHLTEDQQLQVAEEAGELLWLLARNRQQEKQLDEAMRLSDKAESCYTAGRVPSEIWVQRAELLASLGQQAEASQLRTKAEAHPPHTIRAYSMMAQRYLRESPLGFDEALPLLHRAIKRAPDDGWLRFQEGMCHDAQGEDDESVTSYTACIALSPKFHGAYFNRGLAYLRKKDWDKAISDFTEAIELKRDLRDAYINRALAYQGKPRYPEAIADLTHALELDGEVTRIYFMRSRALARAGDQEGSDRDRREGLKKQPRDEQSWIARGLARASGDPEGALADYQQALAINPRSRSALNNKAYLLAEALNRPGEAIQVLDQVVKLFPRYVSARSGRGVVHARLGNRAAALEDAQQTLRLQPTPDLEYQVGCIYALTSLQNRDDALIALEYVSRALRRGFGFQYIATDKDLAPLRSLPEFQRLVQAAEAFKSTRKTR